MHIGLVGLGKMGNNMRARLRNAGIEVTGYDANPAVSDVADLGALAQALPSPRLVWVMVPAGQITDAVIKDLGEVLEPGDLVIDGGNSKWLDDEVHATLLDAKGIRYMDAGVSGGVWGLENGYGLMVGGDSADVERAMPVFDALRPEGPREEGFCHAGAVGAGHYAKMVHNGIEYAHHAGVRRGLRAPRGARTSSRTSPPSSRRGSAARSSVPGCSSCWSSRSTRTPSSTHSRATSRTAARAAGPSRRRIDNAVPMPAISASIFARFVSRQGEGSPTMKAVAALRNQFGGHAVKKA